ncbi:GNAT family N-acetyltransferase [Nocardioides sp. Bht2]|uniref:GNAT family N-acetyltransferase n=1 Tax=Nocardioides sp. Bht2 TaxID=3392297 RepID=UPI0039B62210
MDSGSDLQNMSDQNSQHRLGEHVVGTRIVVRRRIPGVTGPTGGPAFTDVLGTCLRWSDGECVVERENGEQVVVAIAEIVSGKSVPPRAPVRHRVSARQAEEHSLVLWPQVETSPLGDWVLRTDPKPVGRLLKRANSCLAIGDPGRPDSAAVAAVVDFYRDRDREPLAQVVRDTAAEAAFTAAGWEPVAGGDAVFQLGAVSRALRALRSVAPLSFEQLVDRPQTQIGLQDDGVRVALELRVAGRLVAEARGGLSGDWFGLHAILVDPELRRRGLARRMVAELLDWGAERGATTCWLHVEADNHAALALYESLGLKTHHELRYLSPN